MGIRKKAPVDENHRHRQQLIATIVSTMLSGRTTLPDSAIEDMITQAELVTEKILER